jgi:prophage antirepressor-like protein/predicted RNA-binding Zn-ribbon protein involved in translation (DUF1610 family)
MFSFGGHSIRILGTKDRPLFVVKDVCRVLGIKNSRSACKSINNKYKTRISASSDARVALDDTSESFSNARNYLCVTDSGLYDLILKSQKSEKADAFKVWVLEEVLPSIQRNGFYDKKQRVSEEPLLIDDVERGIEQIVKDAVAAGVSKVQKNIDDLTECVKGIKGAVRKKPTTTTMKMHMNTINKYYNRRCPCCGDTVIIGPDGRHIGDIDHWVKVTMAAAQHTWPVCKACNNKFLTQYLKVESRKFFEVYQERLRQANSDHQIKLFDEERIS